MSNLLFCQWSLTDESLSHTQRGHRFYSLMIFLCFIKIHKVNSSKYEWCLDLLTEIFDSWIFITNTEETQTLEWIFICFIRIHKANSPKYEWSLDFMTMMFDSWIFITYIKGTQVLFLNDIHVLYQNPQGELFKVWMVFRYVDSDIWQLNLYHKHKRDKNVLLLNEYVCVLSESTRWNHQSMNGL